MIRFILILGIIPLYNCGHSQHSEVKGPLPSADQAEAVIRPSYARFVFPKETAREYTWNVPAPEASSGKPESSWQVRWDPPSERWGQDPHALWMIVYWRPGGPHTGPLADLLQGWKPMVMTACMKCGTPASTSREDSSIRMRALENRVVFTVEGAHAVKRLFPSEPDTVIFLREMGPGHQVEDTVAVEH
jgi:hypothetical protein